jgi:hypothetical protein
MTGTYGYPNVGSYGLAHSLLAWGRCVVWCNQRQIPMLAPNWLHIQQRIGPWLRKERDKRQYQRLFTFPGYVTGLRRAWLVSRLPRVDADTLQGQASVDTAPDRLIVFTNRLSKNFETYFHEITGHGPALYAAMRHITRPQYLPEPVGEPHVAVHVRLGDFTVPASEAALRSGQTNSQLPLSWYVLSLQKLRAGLGHDVPAVVYSDGSDAALKPLLQLRDVRRASGRSAVTDMLGIAEASALISSGSGFSIWGAFLGSVPRICFPGQRLIRALPQAPAIELEPEVDFDMAVPDDFLHHVKKLVK